jgi:nitrate/nitrite-specific signal transduction histidine kinase
VLTVENNGRPFPDLTAHATGLGLKIMNYRASLIGASLEVKGLGSKGTLVTCTIPADGRNTPEPTQASARLKNERGSVEPPNRVP